jgi:hypothetical protein
VIIAVVDIGDVGGFEPVSVAVGVVVDCTRDVV